MDDLESKTFANEWDASKWASEAMRGEYRMYESSFTKGFYIFSQVGIECNLASYHKTDQGVWVAVRHTQIVQ